MSKLTIEGSDEALKMFVDWFHEQGEQGFMECWDGGQWNGKETVYPTTYISVSGGYDGLRFVEYDIASDEEVK
ncbi:hypothetical protein EpJS10_0107 [Escherichia phage JS10]|uniref:Uncharacterized protein n=1 Tax=Escherichia phage JS10 TaxID=576790 RepID=C4MZK2_9CAUD|nr:hypothetical protein EpJS10_0107 [Escherichia phage JS10]ACL78333.1 hypothetical protein EpJS10_0107 [Escherichia phage JS10]